MYGELFLPLNAQSFILETEVFLRCVITMTLYSLKHLDFSALHNQAWKKVNFRMIRSVPIQTLPQDTLTVEYFG